MYQTNAITPSKSPQFFFLDKQINSEVHMKKLKSKDGQGCGGAKTRLTIY